MNYSKAREYIKTIEQYGMVLGLESMNRLLEHIGNPQNKLSFVHVAGTNGKGSVITYVSEALIRAGYRTGVYTSPAVFEPLEIYRMNHSYMSKDTYGRLMDTMKTAMDTIVAAGHPSPTVYELETALAFLYFAEEHCDIVVLETGLGGLLDATNCISAPVCAVLTSISMDHVGVLGDTLEQIAIQKTGIIKEGCRVISSPQADEVLQVILRKCEEKQVPLTIGDLSKAQIDDKVSASGKDAVTSQEVVQVLSRRTITYKHFPEITIGLLGKHQIENAVTALEVVEQLRQAGYHIEDCHVKEAIGEAVWPGRLSVLSKEPLVLMDGAHNERAAKQLVNVLEEDFPGVQWCFVMGVLKDKEYEKIVQYMAPYAQKVYTITPDSPRALSGQLLAEVFVKYGCKEVECCSNIEIAEIGVEQAVKKAVAWCEDESRRGILAFGSFTFLKEFRSQIEQTMFRVNRLLKNQEFLEKIKQLEQLEQDRQFCRHGWEHSMDVARVMALLNVERELGFSKEFLYALALIHDLGRVDEYVSGIPHEEAGMALAQRLLPSCGFDAEEIAAIADAIGGHRDKNVSKSVLTGLLVEADKKTRLCFQCKAREQCKWPENKKNMTVQI